jgi:hypothetical protein
VSVEVSNDEVTRVDATRDNKVVEWLPRSVSIRVTLPGNKKLGLTLANAEIQDTVGNPGGATVQVEGSRGRVRRQRLVQAQERDMKHIMDASRGRELKSVSSGANALEDTKGAGKER